MFPTREEQRDKKLKVEEKRRIKTEREAKKKLRKDNKVVKKFFIRFALFIVLTIILVFIYAYFLGAKGLVIKEYAVYNERLPESFGGIKIVHLSDIHYGSSVGKRELNHIVDKVNMLKPDIVVITGDLFIDNKYSDSVLDEYANILNRIDADIAKYVINGNHDVENNDFNMFIEETDFINLDNRYEYIYYKGDIPILIAGVSSYFEDKVDVSEKLKDLYEAVGKSDDVSYKILLMHEPDLISNLEDGYFDLILSGHTHGGQVRLPFIRPPFLPPLGEKYYDTYYHVKGSDLYVSSGLGTSGIDIRLFNKPSFNFYRLRKKS